MTPADELRQVFSPGVVEILDAHIDARIEQALDLREHERRWLSIPEAAVYLGTTVAAIRKRVARGTIPHTRDNGRVLIDRRRLDAVLEAWK